MKYKKRVTDFFRIDLQRLLLLALVLFCVFALSSLAMASSYYVAPNGNDSNNGLFPSYQNGFDGPFRTVNRAAGAARAGDTVFIRGGTYHETVNFSANGTSANRITITSYENEEVIIDGEYTLPTGSVYYYLCTVSGDYITLSNITIKRSAGSLFVLSGDYDRAINVTGIGSRESGIVAGGNYNVFDGCTMTDNGNGYGIGGQGTWGSAICTVGSNTTIQNCTSFENKGEGINAYSRSSNSIIQDNIVYDNRSYNLYLDSSNGSIVRRNIVYQTKLGYAQYGITIGAETGQPSSILVCNNLVVGCFANFHIDSNVANLANAKVIYNTFVNSTGYANEGYNMGVYFRPDTNTYSNSIFTNNIVLEETPGRVPVFVESAHPGLTFSNNCWSRNPVAAAVGVGDVLGDPKLAKSGLTGPGSLTSAWFKIQEDSPARYQAQSVAEVAEDFFRNPRGGTPDMGAIEASGTTSPLRASLGGSPATGHAPLTVNFVGSASGGTSPYSYKWAFGDGETSTSQNPSHTYQSAGEHTIILTVTDRAAATANATMNITVTSVVPLSATATASPISGQAPLAVNFSGTASGGISPHTYRWTFGDGGSSTSQNPSHSYSSAGSYTATLTITDNASATASSTVNISVTSAVPLGANIVASPTSGPAPLAVRFAGSASGGKSPFTYRWAFGDGASSTSQSPSHSYSTAGSYRATLTVTDSASATANAIVNISVSSAVVPLSASAAGTPTSGSAPLAVNFMGSASGGTSPYTYRWTFGDGSSSSSQNPAHTYSTAGTHGATLTVTDNAARTASSVMTINVAVPAVPLSAQLVASVTAGVAPFSVDLAGTASGGAPPYSYSWAFGDGSTSTAQNPSHIYSFPGSYVVILRVSDSRSARASASASIMVRTGEKVIVSRGLRKGKIKH